MAGDGAGPPLCPWAAWLREAVLETEGTDQGSTAL